MIKTYLSNREFEVMLVLWKADKPLAATDIPKIQPKLKLNTVQAVLKKLLTNNYIKVTDIIYHGKVLTRTYVSVLTYEEYIMSQLNNTRLSSFGLASALVKNEKNAKTLTELEQLIKEQKALLKMRGESD